MKLAANGAQGRYLAIGTLFAGTALLYARVSAFPFIYFDDPQYITENAHVRAGLSCQNVKWALTTFHFSNWHPLTWLSYMLDVHLFGVDAGALHIVNALLHAASSALVFLAFDEMTGARGRSLFVATLFAVHPIHVESVAWVAERKDVLSTLFGLVALVGYGRYSKSRSWPRYAAVALAFALSLAAKPMWVTLPFVLLLLDAWPLQRIKGSPLGQDRSLRESAKLPFHRLLLEKVPLLALSVASASITLMAQRSGGAVAEVPVGTRIANAAVSYARYLEKTMWPVGLAAYYPFPPHGPGIFEVLVASAVVGATSVLVLRHYRRQPWLAIGWAWFLGTLVPVIGVVQVGGQAMADRYAYLPSIGLFFAVTWGAHAWFGQWASGLPLRLAAITVAAVLAALTWRQIGFWSDHVSLFRHAIAVTEFNARAHAYLSDGLRKAGRLDEALAEAREAVRLEPWSARARLNMAMIECDLGWLPDARLSLRQAVELDPHLAIAWALLGEVETALGREDEGERLLVRAAAMAPRDADIAERLERVRAYRASIGR